MSLKSPAWLLPLAAVGRAFIDVLEAEWSALTADLSASARRLLRGLLILCLAMVALGWVLGVISLALISYLHLFLEWWQSAGIVAILLLALSAALFLWAKSILGGIRPPTELVQRRVQEHVAWLQGQFPSSHAEGEEDEDALD